jgi:hypothetical protein
MQDIALKTFGGKTEAIAAAEAAIGALPRQGQTAEQETAERERLEALKARLEALP